MAKIALTDITVSRLKPGVYVDLKTPAFGIRVGKNRKTWFATKGRKRRTITLGHYPAVSLQDARRLALAAFIEPEERAVRIQFVDAKSEFLEQGHWRPQTKRVLTSTLNHFHWITPLRKISTLDVVTALQAIEGKSARWHARKDITTFFNWCVPRYLAHSPMQGIKSERQPSRERVLTDDELASVWGACEGLGAIGSIVRLLILTGQRRTAIGSLRWEWVQADRIVWPGDASKNGRQHSLPMTKSAAAIISAQDRQAEFVFNARRQRSDDGHQPYSGWSTGLARVQKASGTSGWTLHDLRRSFATGLARNGTAIHVTEKILSHASGRISGVAAIYNRFDYWNEQREALEAWERYIATLSSKL